MRCLAYCVVMFKQEEESPVTLNTLLKYETALFTGNIYV